ncbi:MAG: helix-turn-helix transcriptional regulator [Tabrizicola sp.]|nr:helix-turn-helix transcriptional regulator [Tabrizicola sp.]
MVTAPSPPRSGCPIHLGPEIFGDRFSLLILRDVVLHGKRRFSEFLTSGEGIATNIPTARLSRLEAAGLLRRTTLPGDRRGVIYAPTEAAVALVPALVELAFWGATHDAATAAPAEFVAAYRADRAGFDRNLPPRLATRQARRRPRASVIGFRDDAGAIRVTLP